MHSLPLFHRIAGRRVVVAGSGAAAAAKRRLVERAGGICCGEAEAHSAGLAFVAMEDERAAEKAALRLKRAGLLVNVADRPDLCDFTLPSVLDRDPVLIAVSTGGASAGLAKHLRLRLEALLPPWLGLLAQWLDARREDLRARYPEGAARRGAIDAMLGEGGPLDPLAVGTAAWLDQVRLPDVGQADGRTVRFAIASDDPDDLTLRQARWLGQADTVLHDPAVAEAVLVRARADAVRLALPAEPPAQGFTVIVARG